MSEKKLVALFVVAILGVGVVWYFADRKLGSAGSRSSGTGLDLEFNDGPAQAGEEASTILPAGTVLPALPGEWISTDAKVMPAPVYAGKVVLVDVWSTFCMPCIASIPANNELSTKYGPKGLFFVGVSHENKGMLLDFKSKVEIKYPLLATSEETLRNFRIEFFPSLFLFGKDGKLVWQGTHIMNKNNKLQSSFSKALKEALNAPDSPPASAKAAAAYVDPKEVELPEEFEKLMAEARAAAKSSPVVDEEETGLKLGAEIPALKGDWIAANGGTPELKNKVLLIDFFTTSCGTCVESMPHNNKIYERFSPQGFVFVNATPEEKELIHEFKRSVPINYPVLTNCSALFEFCVVREIPLTLLFDRAGKLIWKGGRVEDAGKIDPVFEKMLTSALAAK